MKLRFKIPTVWTKWRYNLWKRRTKRAPLRTEWDPRSMQNDRERKLSLSSSDLHKRDTIVVRVLDIWYEKLVEAWSVEYSNKNKIKVLYLETGKRKSMGDTLSIKFRQPLFSHLYKKYLSTVTATVAISYEVSINLYLAPCICRVFANLNLTL